MIPRGGIGFAILFVIGSFLIVYGGLKLSVEARLSSEGVTTPGVVTGKREYGTLLRKRLVEVTYQLQEEAPMKQEVSLRKSRFQSLEVGSGVSVIYHPLVPDHLQIGQQVRFHWHWLVTGLLCYVSAAGWVAFLNMPQLKPAGGDA